jgi:ubiquinone/menaquinone biosynthesis C-methylase UbiE
MVEIGSGRGGGLDYVVTVLKPESALGVDYSKNQVEFCLKNYKHPNINFIEGDAENLNLPSQSFDMVLNVESSHCYGNFQKFIDEVARILRPGGRFLLTDFMDIENVENYEFKLKEKFKFVQRVDITLNVLIALKLDTQRRIEWIDKGIPAFATKFVKRFAGCEGSRIYQRFLARESVYLAYELMKKEE